MSKYLFILLLLVLTSCVSSKRHKTLLAEEQQRTALSLDSLAAARAAIDSLDDELLRSRGGNELLLIAHNQLQDRLLVLDDQNEELRGNLSSTQSNMSRRLEKLENENRELTALEKKLRSTVLTTVDNFTLSLEPLSDSLKNDSLFIGATIRGRNGILSVNLPEDWLFRTNSSSRLSDDAQQYLGPIAKALDADPSLDLIVVGHTDNQTDRRRGDNWSFSAARAVTIAKELSDGYFISPNRLSAEGKGEFAPLQSNATADGRAANRRIEFQLVNSLGGLLRQLKQLGE